MKIPIISIIMLVVIVAAGARQTINKKMEEKMLIIKDGTTQISYFEKGKGDQTLLFLHGWCINKSYWKSQLHYFSQFHKVIAVDLPGFGQSTSTRSNWSVEQYGEDIIEVIDQLKLRNVILIGHSMSGEIVLEAALKNHPEISGLIGVDNFKMIDFQFSPEQLEEMNHFIGLLATDFKQMATDYADKMLFHETTNEKVKERVKNDFTSASPDIGFSTLSNLFNYSQIEPAKLQQLNYKLHLINSDATPTYVEGLRNNCKSSYDISNIHATGHYPMIERPGEFNELLKFTIQNMK